ncbi:TolC family protein [Rhodoflexus sp.]
MKHFVFKVCTIAVLITLCHARKLIALGDSTIFGIRDFYRQLAIGHPIIKQAMLLSEMGRQEIRLARGFFDPKLMALHEFKDFKGQNYFNTWNVEVKLPTAFGVDFKAGFEQNSGLYLNPKDNTPSSGLMYAGVILPIAQGLLFDQRRAILQQAQYMNRMLEAERIKVINKVVLQATKDYWQWYAAYKQLQIAQKGFELAKIRYDAVKIRIIQGDLAAIDSVEAKITLQEREVTLNNMNVLWNNARLILSNHLWGEDSQPLELAVNVLPTNNLNELGESDQIETLLQYARENHPELLKLDFKIKQMEIERRLAIEMLKPVINLNYNFLGQSPLFDESNSGAFFRNNYKYGIEFAFPLFLRKERAKLAQTNIKLKQGRFELSQLNREILNDINAIFNDLQNLRQQLVIQEQMINNYQILLRGEQIKFLNGESSLFLLNSREEKLLEGEQKFVDFQFKYAKSFAELLWAAGKNPAGDVME